MPHDIYKTSLIVLACTLVFCGLYLHFGKFNTQLKKNNYKLSRHLMGYAYLVIALDIITYFIVDMHNINSKYALALNISSCFIVSKLIGESFIKLIGRRIKINKFHKIFIYLFPFIIWCSILISDSLILHISQFILSIILLISILVDTKLFFIEYKIAKVHNKYLYEESVGLHISWMISIVHYIIYFGILSAVILLFYKYLPKWALTIYTTSFIILAIYVFNRYLLYTNIHNVLSATNNKVTADSNSSILSTDTKSHIQKEISNWIKTKKYFNKELNIASVAKDISTNRLYLSNYINNVYNCSFRVWVSQLRINEAKRLMSENRELSITEVADMVGFKSLTTFTHSFRASEGMSPREWIKKSIK